MRLRCSYPHGIELRKATLKGLLRRTHAGVAFNRHFEAAGESVYGTLRAGAKACVKAAGSLCAACNWLKIEWLLGGKA